MPRISPTPPRVLVVLGTRPEAIKLAPVCRALAASTGLELRLVSTGQHREMLDQMLSRLQLRPHHELALMRERQSLPALTARLGEALAEVIDEDRPDAVLVQGDTTTAYCGALAAFYARVPVGHVEAGLRTGLLDNPFPEEANRRLIGQLARWHFAPTARAAANLHAEGIGRAQVMVTGNTGIDNLLWAVNEGQGRHAFRTEGESWRILVTLHRRENQGEAMRGLAVALRQLTLRGDVEVLLPLHLSPAVREALLPVVEHCAGVTVVEPLDYLDFTASLQACDLVLTDSGGVQEEAPTLGKPVLVLRETTERPEAIEAGTAELLGVDPARVVGRVSELLDDAQQYARMAHAVNPFGDGKAAGRILDRLVADLIPLQRESTAVRPSGSPARVPAQADRREVSQTRP